MRTRVPPSLFALSTTATLVMGLATAARPQEKAFTLALDDSPPEARGCSATCSRSSRRRAAGSTCGVVAVGTGQALELGRRGDADALLVHAPAAERQFIEHGYGVDRRRVMYNDFVVVGPGGDPAGVAGAGSAAQGVFPHRRSGGAVCLPRRRQRYPQEGTLDLGGDGGHAVRPLVR
ncbi:MAG: substrate-binding domain-containing protein [Arhodomonas sp.]|nr:substrate-binding domain-containing protein [Arhodomonas sp.]